MIGHLSDEARSDVFGCVMSVAGRIYMFISVVMRSISVTVMTYKVTERSVARVAPTLVIINNIVHLTVVKIIVRAKRTSKRSEGAVRC